MTNSAVSAGALELFGWAQAYALERLDELTPDALDRPTPCVGWDVRTVVLHLADVADAVIGLLDTGRLAMPEPRAAGTPEPVEVARERIRALRARFERAAEEAEEARAAGEDPGGEDPGGEDPAGEPLAGAAQAAANELAAHGWDLAAGNAAGSAGGGSGVRPIPDALATALLALVDGRLDAAARGSNFAPAVDLAAAEPRTRPGSGAPSASDRFLAYLGRNPFLADSAVC